ncbi:MAG TPA: TolC family protein [Terriglobales bacterium]|nr:TolC family protein [Terriglobales bacterium]
MKRAATNSNQERHSRATRALLCLTLGMVIVSFCGCALHKPPPHATIVDQALPKATPLPQKWSAAPDTVNVSDDWVKSFNDSGLEEVVREAIANNLDLRQSAARVEAARQSVIVVGSKLKPHIGATIGGATTHSSNMASSDQFQSNMEYAAFSWELDVWGRLRSQRAAAQENYEAVALDYAFARQSLAAITAKSWYLAIETRQLLALTEQSVNIYTKLFELVKIRRAAGRVADLDVAEASYQLNEAKNQLAIAQGLYSEARRTLEVLVGRYPAAELAVAEAFAPLPQPVAPGLPSSLLERRPDIIAAEHQVLAAFRTQQAAKLALLPSFSLSLEGGRLSDRLLSVLSLNPALGHGVIGMYQPIYQGGALIAQIKIATAQQEQSIAYFGSVALRALDEVEVELTNEQLLAQRLPHTENAVSDHIEAVRVANLRYTAGNMDLLSVLQLQEGQIQSQAALIKLRNAQLANRINLHLALGGSFDGSPATTSPAATSKNP